CQVAEDWRGWVFDTLEEGDFIRGWVLVCGGHILLVSYSCAVEDKSMDISVVEQILDSLRLKDESREICRGSLWRAKQIKSCSRMLLITGFSMNNIMSLFFLGLSLLAASLAGSADDKKADFSILK